MTISAEVVCDSISPDGVRLTTMVLEYPRFIHAEFMTHRVFSRNASSSRAIPVAKVLERIRTDTATPVHWGSNKPGMQAGEELSGDDLAQVIEDWEGSALYACQMAEAMMNSGLHKQVANRVTEPFAHIKVVVTSTEWENFFHLRDHHMAQPEIHELAIQMKAAIATSEPRTLNYGDWHLPFVLDEEREKYDIEILKQVSTARNARVSYLNHDKSEPVIEEDIQLHAMLGVRPYHNPVRNIHLEAGEPVHLSPFEHVAKCVDTGGDGFYPETWTEGMTHISRDGTMWSGNLREWAQYRQMM